MANVSSADICKVLNYFWQNSYRACTNDKIVHEALANCIELIKLDYQYSLISNTQGELSAHYPPELIILENELQNPISVSNANSRNHTDTIYENNIIDKRVLLEHITRARTARCRTRFVVPVILFRGKQICRSSTVAGQPEIYTRHSYEYLSGTGIKPIDDILLNEDKHKDSPKVNVDASKYNDLPLMDQVYHSDVDLLKLLNVSTIIDLMVETRKVKFNLYITSSEKVQTHYDDFTIMSLPYPGCEFFAEYRQKDYEAEKCNFNWDQSYVNATLTVPQDLLNQVKIDASKYRDWNLVQLTQNYMKILLRLVNDNSCGILVHCISGWDRTPLYISLLRISLWADKAIHHHLTPLQILYFTLTYDWMLFGHDLANRLSKGEEILFFCFQMLKYLHDDEFSINHQNKKGKHGLLVGGSNSSTSSNSNMQRADSEMHLEDDTNGSNVSLNSTSSSNSARDTDSSVPTSNVDTDVEMANGNSPPLPRSSPSSSTLQQTRRTSPIAVPSTRRRQRTDSTSSFSCGSWQMVSGCGSLEKNPQEKRHNLHDHVTNRNESIEMHTGTSSSDSGSTSFPVRTDRQARLEEVRVLFGNLYGGTVGLKMKGGEIPYYAQPFAQTFSTFYSAFGQISAVALAATARQLDDK